MQANVKTAVWESDPYFAVFLTQLAIALLPVYT